MHSLFVRFVRFLRFVRLPGPGPGAVTAQGNNGF
jgi:hypothetical protein